MSRTPEATAFLHQEKQSFIRTEGKLQHPADLENSIVAAEQRGKARGVRDVLEAFVDEAGNFLVLTREQAAERVVEKGTSSFKKSTILSEKIFLAFGLLRGATTAPLTIRETAEAAGENGRRISVFYLAYRRK